MAQGGFSAFRLALTCMGKRRFLSLSSAFTRSSEVLGAWMTVHGLILLVGGLAFGVAVVRARILPRWTGICLPAGVVLVAAVSGLPDIARTGATAVPAIAFIGMGLPCCVVSSARALTPPVAQVQLRAG